MLDIRRTACGGGPVAGGADLFRGLKADKWAGDLWWGLAVMDGLEG